MKEKSNLTRMYWLQNGCTKQKITMKPFDIKGFTVSLTIPTPR